MREGNNVVVSRDRCPTCGSKDNLVTYADGHRFCYTPGCGLKETSKVDHQANKMETKPKGSAVPFTDSHMAEGLKARKLKLKYLQMFGYFVHKANGKTAHIAPYYDQSGRMVLQKYRSPEKEFWFTPVVDHAPQPKACQLFGQQVWGERFDRKVVVTEGELDAISVAQATEGKIAVVSIPAGVGSAVDSLKANYRWLDRFEEVVLWMDNDEPGQAVVDACAQLFVGKAKTIRVEGFKDASELLQAGQEGAVYQAVYSAVKWQPAGIVNASACTSDMEDPDAEAIAEYPWPRLQAITLGIRSKEVVYHVAGTGSGKTSALSEIMSDLIGRGIKIGVMRFEDTRRKAQMDLMSIRANRRLHIHPVPKEERLRLHAAVFGSGLVELFDPETADWGFEAIKAYIRYMAKGLGCRVIFIDPLSFIVAGVDITDERKALDKVAHDFARIVKQYDVCLQISHHLRRPEGKAHEEGAEISVADIRGSGGIANFSMAIFGYERDQQGERTDLSRIRVLKNRHVGTTGIADTLKWDDETGRLEATDEPYPNDPSGGTSFGPAHASMDY